MFLSHLRDQLGIKGIRSVSLHEPLRQRAAGDLPAIRAGRRRAPRCGAACTARPTLRADCGKIVIAVSEDIDPTNTNAVFWSMAYRANPVEDVHVAPHRSSGHGPKSGPRPQRFIAADRRHAQAGVSAARAADAANTWSARARSGTSSACRRCRRSRPGTATRSATGPTTGKPTPSAPSTGDWEKSGKETFARRRGGLTPETPVRDAEPKSKL